jgi:VWFA-related protein
MSTHRPQIALLLMLLMLGSAAAGAQEPETPIFVESVDVEVINVEVFVTDGDGHRVVGLAKEDFEIYEDGKPVPITNFFAVAREDPVLAGLDRDRAELLGEPAPRRASPLPEDQRLHLVVYVDHFNLHPQHRARVLDDLGSFLEDRLIQGDRVMLVGFSRRLEVVEPFTQDRRRVFDGLERMRKVAAHRPIQDAERLRIMGLMARASREESALIDLEVQMRNAHQMVRSYVQSTRNDLELSSRALRQTVRSLAGLPGRKALLYVSSGLPQRPGEELYELMTDLFGQEAFQGVGPTSDFNPGMEAMLEDESHLFGEIVQEANAHQVTFYTVDARGAGGETASSPAFPNLSASEGGRMVLDQMWTLNLQEPLVRMAETTGGQSILNTFNFSDVLTDMAEDFDTFYSLGYQPPPGREPKYHKIEVKVAHPGFRVRHRAGYESKLEADRVSDRTLSSLLLGLEKNPLGVRVEFGKPEKAGAGKFDLPILVRVPVQEVTLLFQEASAEGRLTFFVVVQDAEGISDMHRQPYPVSIPSEQLEAARGREIGWAGKLRIRRGTPTIAVGVWDELSGVESFVQTRVLVEQPGERGRGRTGR